MKAAPPPGASSTHARPPWSSAKRRTMKSPSPRPLASRPPWRSKASKIRLLGLVGHARSSVGHRQHEVVPAGGDLDAHGGAGGRVVGRIAQEVVDDAGRQADVEVGDDRGGREGQVSPVQAEVPGLCRDELVRSVGVRRTTTYPPRMRSASSRLERMPRTGSWS